MAKVQVYLPDELHKEMIRLKLVPSHLLQDAVREAVADEQRRAAAREMIAIIDKVARPTPKQLADGEAWVEQLLGGATSPAAAATGKRRAR